MLWKELLLVIVSVVLVNASPTVTAENFYGKLKLVVLLTRPILNFSS